MNGVMNLNISFLGAAGTVTGSNYLITTEKYKFILDCGQFQGGKKTEAMNFTDFAYNPADIDFMILSHAHIDHSGRIPKFVKEGFKGRIYCTRGTSDLADILLKDSGYIHEKETEWENRKRARAGLPAIEPLYTVADAEVAVKYLYPVLYNQTILINDEVTVRFKDAGHILGSAIVEIWVKENSHEKKLVFSGDLGMMNKPLLRDPEFIDEADYLLIESTYGNRFHEHPEQRIDKLIKIILDTTDRGGTVVIPSFAVGRTQEIIYELNKYYDNKEEGKRFNKIPVYIDSPLATRATEIFRKNAEVFDEETREFIMSGDNPLDFKNLHFTKTVEESIALNKNVAPKIVISASGMANAGRIKHHLKHNLWRPECSVIFVGYQAEGTLGRRIKNGEKNVRIFGEQIQINAEIHAIEGFSGHADQNGLLNWLKGFKKFPEKIFIVHGEDDSREGFKNVIESTFDVKPIIPKINEVFNCRMETAEPVETVEEVLMADKEDTEELLSDLTHLREIYASTLKKTGNILAKKVKEDEFNLIKNKLIEMERNAINLEMLLGDRYEDEA